MPLYEYLCDDCNTKFERRRAMQEIDAPTACPECDSEHVTRQISLFFALTAGDSAKGASNGGCGCGGACSCGGGHGHN
jgi:putative FmdB family regulatory protein